MFFLALCHTLQLFTIQAFFCMCAGSSGSFCTCKSSSFSCAEPHSITSSRTVPVPQLPAEHHHLRLCSGLQQSTLPDILVFCSLFIILQLPSCLPPLFPLDKYTLSFLPSFHLCSFPLFSTGVLHMCPRLLGCL